MDRRMARRRWSSHDITYLAAACLAALLPAAAAVGGAVSSSGASGRTATARPPVAAAALWPKLVWQDESGAKAAERKPGGPAGALGGSGEPVSVWERINAHMPLLLCTARAKPSPHP
jgi:hypothetical protein